MHIEHQATAEKGRFVISEGGKELGEMTYQVSAPGEITIDHTLGFPGSKGKGVGIRLLDAAVAHARKNGLRIVPACSFVAHVMESAPEEYADVS